MSSWFQSYGFADVHDELLIGAYPLDERDVAMLERVGIRRVLNLAQDAEYPNGQREVVASALAAAGIQETRLGIEDHGNLSSAALEQAVRTVVSWLQAGERTYIHCRAGWQRSAAVAAGVVAITEGVDLDAALASVRQRKPSADPLPHQRQDMERWWREREPQSASASASEYERG